MSIRPRPSTASEIGQQESRRCRRRQVPVRARTQVSGGGWATNLLIATCRAHSVVRAVVVETADSRVARLHECRARAPETCKIRKHVSAPGAAQTCNARVARPGQRSSGPARAPCSLTKARLCPTCVVCHAARAKEGSWLSSLLSRRSRARNEANLTLTAPCSREFAGLRRRRPTTTSGPTTRRAALWRIRGLSYRAQRPCLRLRAGITARAFAWLPMSGWGSARRPERHRHRDSSAPRAATSSTATT